MPSTICLNMIVKNEAAVIGRCLESVRDFVDSWVIIDTGSSDGTQSIIRELMKDIPGVLFERPWVDFGHNRTEAIQLAEGRADYLLLCDADMVLELRDPDWKDKLLADSYLVMQHHNGSSYRNIRIVNARLTGDRRWRYWASTHEYCDSVRPGQNSKLNFDGIAFLDRADGGSKADKFSRDAALLERDIRAGEDLRRRCAKDPERADLKAALDEHEHLLPRTVFYLAQTYRDMGQLQKSLSTYQRRANMGGWDEEVWYSLYQIAKLSERLKLAPEIVIDRYLQAYQARFRRAEPLIDLARIYRERKQFVLAHLFAERAIKTKRPDDALFLDMATYNWRAIDEYAVASYWVGNYEDCARACETLIERGAAPEEHLARITKNLHFATTALAKNKNPAPSSFLSVGALHQKELRPETSWQTHPLGYNFTNQTTNG